MQSKTMQDIAGLRELYKPTVHVVSTIRINIIYFSHLLYPSLQEMAKLRREAADDSASAARSCSSWAALVGRVSKVARQASFRS